MPIDGSGSNFPTSLDDWGEEFLNNQCQRFRAGRFNTIQHAVYALEKHTRRIMLTGGTRVYRHDTGADRPRLLVKTFVVTLTGSSAEFKTAPLPAFTADELNFFDQKPLGEGNNVHLHVRKLRATNSEDGTYIAALQAPIADNGSSQQLVLAPLRDFAGEKEFKIGAGDYLVTLLITR